MIKELHILLTLNKEHKKIFPNVPVVGFGNGKSLKDYVVTAKWPKLEESGICEPCGKKTCLVCDSISTAATFTAEVRKETFKIQKATLNSDFKKVLYLLKWKVCAEICTLGKQKPGFAIGSTITKIHKEHSERMTKKFLKDVFTLSIVSTTKIELIIGIS